MHGAPEIRVRRQKSVCSSAVVWLAGLCLVLASLAYVYTRNNALIIQLHDEMPAAIRPTKRGAPVACSIRPI